MTTPAENFERDTLAARLQQVMAGNPDDPLTLLVKAAYEAGHTRGAEADVTFHVEGLTMQQGAWLLLNGVKVLAVLRAAVTRQSVRAKFGNYSPEYQRATDAENAAVAALGELPK